MRTLALLAIAITAAAGCGDKAVELRLDIPTGADAEFDVSCVNSVEVAIWGEESFSNECLTITGATSIAEVEDQLRGQFEADLPDDLIAFQVRGLATDQPELCGSGDMIFYAGTDYAHGDDDVNLPVMGTLDCAVRAASTPRTVRLVNFRDLVATPPASPPNCTPTADVQLIESGTIHPSNMSPPLFSPTVTTTWQLGSVVNGTTTLPVWNRTLGHTCPGLVTYDADGFPDATACIDPSAPTVCAAAGELEVPMLDWADALPSYDDALQADNLGVVIGTVWDASLKVPVANAQVRIIEGEGQIVYGSWDAVGSRFVANTGGSATTAGGMFMLYANDPVMVTVTSGLHQQRALVLGAPWAAGAAAIIALQPR